jgi:hypothetical protein
MKKIISIVLILAVLLSVNAYAIDSKIIDLRNKIFEQSRQIKPLIRTSPDVVLLTGMFDSCLLIVSQIDAYTYMLSIFNTIKEAEVDKRAFDYLTEWLVLMRRTSELNLKSLDDVVEPVDRSTKIHIARLRDYFINLNAKIDSELTKFVRIKRLMETGR